MSDVLPAFLDLNRIGEALLELDGCLDPGQLPRLRGVARLNRAVQVHLKATDVDGRQFVDGRVRAELGLTCQRCMRPFSWPVAADFHWVWIRDPAGAERLPEGYDAMASATGRVNVAGMIEDELLLALPMVAKHAPPEKCADWRLRAEPRRPEVGDNAAPGPFEVLRALKRR